MSVPGFTGTASLYRSSGQYRASGRFTQAQGGVVASAIHWGGMSYSCTDRPGVGKYSAILWGIPWGQSWEQACATTPAPPDDPAIAGRLPTRCVNTVFNEWGEWDVTDHTCCQQVCAAYGPVCGYDYPSLDECIASDCTGGICLRTPGGYACCSDQCVAYIQNCG